MDLQDKEICDIAIKEAVRRINADAQACAIDFSISDEIAKSNMTLNKLPAIHALTDAAYRLLYKVYISTDFEIKYVPKTWFDHLKRDLCNKFPFLFNYLTINYDSIQIEYKTIMPPTVKVDNATRVFHWYEPKGRPSFLIK